MNLSKPQIWVVMSPAEDPDTIVGCFTETEAEELRDQIEEKDGSKCEIVVFAPEKEAFAEGYERGLLAAGGRIERDDCWCPAYHNWRAEDE